jgi:hypothetical protein
MLLQIPHNLFFIHKVDNAISKIANLLFLIFQVSSKSLVSGVVMLVHGSAGD